MNLDCGQEVRRFCLEQDTIGVAAACTVVGFVAIQRHTTSVTGDLRGIPASSVGKISLISGTGIRIIQQLSNFFNILVKLLNIMKIKSLE